MLYTLYTSNGIGRSPSVVIDLIVNTLLVKHSYSRMIVSAIIDFLLIVLKSMSVERIKDGNV